MDNRYFDFDEEPVEVPAGTGEDVPYEDEQ